MHRSSGGMTKILKRLEASGLVERRPDPDDGRGSRVVLTSRGLALQDRVFHAFAAATSSLLAPLGPERRRSLDAALRMPAIEEVLARAGLMMGKRPGAGGAVSRKRARRGGRDEAGGARRRDDEQEASAAREAGR
ncbi:MAG: MarR family transcriptional regulator [Myxococcota bacterium]